MTRPAVAIVLAFPFVLQNSSYALHLLIIQGSSKNLLRRVMPQFFAIVGHWRSHVFFGSEAPPRLGIDPGIVQAVGYCIAKKVGGVAVVALF